MKKKLDEQERNLKKVEMKLYEKIKNRIILFVSIIILISGYLFFFQQDKLFSNKINQILMSIIIGSTLAVIYSIVILSRFKYKK